MGIVSALKSTYKSLVQEGTIIGSYKDNPIFTKSSTSITSDNAALINISETLVAGTEKTLLTVRNRATFNSNPNIRSISMATLTLSTSGNKAVIFTIYKNASTGGTFADWNTLNSRVEVNTTATKSITTSTIAGITKIDEEVGNTIVAKEATERINLLEGDITITLKANETFTITAESSQVSDIKMSLRIKE